MTFHLGVPQGIYLGLCLLSVIRGVVKHGEPDGTVNAYSSLVSVIGVVALLWWGGFFGCR